MVKWGLRWVCLGVVIALYWAAAGGDEIRRRSVATPIGDLVITKVDIGNRFPPGCGDPGPLCHAVESGFKVLTVWLEGEGEPSEASEYLMDIEGIYVVSGDGNRTDRFAGGMTEGGLFIAFTPPESDAGFVLY